MTSKLNGIKLFAETGCDYLSSQFKKTLYCVSFRTPNWGDYLNKVLIEKITGANVHIVHINYLKKNWLNNLYKNKKCFTAIGSIMHYVPEDAFVWGTGCVYYSAKLAINPKKVLSVRGPMTATVLNNSGIDCPALYGDPALLFGKYIDNKHLHNKEIKIGIIPHMSEQEMAVVKKLSEFDEVKIINIEDDFYSVIEQVSKCEIILSSSLHGLMLADILEIPNTWVRFRDDFPGDGFKFNDYYSSIKNCKEMDLKPYFFSEQDNLNNDLQAALISSEVHGHHLDLGELEGVFVNHLESIGAL
ncbi:MAG: hypothetical protein COA79_15715 [Planctomycetota bacterium]|nr:MAG: hypothetical protein COA79_15715 [Planctomycetota bacterium]